MKTGFLLACALLAGHAAAADLTLYADDDYQGRALAVVIDERQLGVLNFDDRASSVVIENGAWILCSDQDYQGQCVTLEPGRYASLQALGIEDTITSVRRRDPVSIVVFSEPRRASDVVLFAAKDYGGASHAVGGSQSDLRAAERAATSVVIARGQWELCGEPGFRGQCVTLGPGKYASLAQYGLERGVASLRPKGN
jgi:hypothetical protein